MLTITAFVIWKLLLPLLVLVAIIDWLTASDDRRIRVLARTGLSQRQVADRLQLRQSQPEAAAGRAGIRPRGIADQAEDDEVGVLDVIERR